MAIRTAVIGLGPIGSLHSSIYQSDSLAELVGVCDRDADRACAAGRRFGVPHFTDAGTLLGALDPELVSIATGGFEYSSDHYEPTLQALEHGAHVLLEKPISNRLDHAREMVDTARRLNRCFAVDFNHRFTPAARAAHEWLARGELGSLLFCNMALWIGKFGELDSVNYHLKALNPHSVNMMTWFCGPVDVVQAFAMKAPGRDIWSTASINMKFECGAVGHLTSSYDIARAHQVERCEVAGVGGRLLVEDIWQKATLYPAASMESRVCANPVFGGFRDFDDTFRDRIHHFLQEIMDGIAPDAIDGSGADGLYAQQIIEASIRSIDEGNRPVRIGEV